MPKTKITISTFTRLCRISGSSVLLCTCECEEDLMRDDRANMIGDISRTGTYRKAIFGNAEVAFKGKTVLDLGAGEWDPICHTSLGSPTRS